MCHTPPNPKNSLSLHWQWNYSLQHARMLDFRYAIETWNSLIFNYITIFFYGNNKLNQYIFYVMKIKEQHFSLSLSVFAAVDESITLVVEKKIRERKRNKWWEEQKVFFSEFIILLGEKLEKKQRKRMRRNNYSN